jgi:hypothetical protein
MLGYSVCIGRPRIPSHPPQPLPRPWYLVAFLGHSSRPAAAINIKLSTSDSAGCVKSCRRARKGPFLSRVGFFLVRKGLIWYLVVSLQVQEPRYMFIRQICSVSYTLALRIEYTRIGAVGKELCKLQVKGREVAKHRFCLRTRAYFT